MPDSALGHLLKDLRGERGLTLREIAKLAKALKASKREAKMLWYLAAHAEASPALVAFVRSDPAITYDEFASVASVAHRGAARPDYPKLFGRVRRIIAEENGGG